jgi:hypothetical protein
MYNTQPATTATQHKLSKNTRTMIPPGCWLSDASSLKVSTINLHHAMAHDLRNRVMYFLHKTNLFFILFIFILQAADQRAGRQQVCFLVNTCPFF